VVRSDQEVIRIGSTSKAPPADKQWLADALRAIVSG